MGKPRRAPRRILTFSAILIGSSVVAVVPAFGTTNRITTIVGNGIAGSTGDNGPAVNARLNGPTGVAVNGAGTLFVADTNSNKVRQVVNPTTITTDTITTIAGTGTAGFNGDGAATAHQVNGPTGVAVDSQGNVYIADSGNNRVREITNGTMATIAGNGASCKNVTNLGNGGPALNATLCNPTGIAVDSSTTPAKVYVSDTGNNEVRVITGGTINAFAGNGHGGYSGDGGTATNAMLNSPTGLAVDALHNVYIGDTGNSIVREVSGGKITLFAGTPGKFGFAGDGNIPTKAKLNGPTGIGTDSSGNVYISDTGNNRLRIVAAGGMINTFAGSSNNAGFGGDGGPAQGAMLSQPTGNVAVNSTAVYFGDTGNNRVRGVFSGPLPVLPETNWAILLPLGGLVLAGAAGFVMIRRRRLAAQPTV
jgi:LPXTG-motif cell wall-anchored protein